MKYTYFSARTFEILGLTMLFNKKKTGTIGFPRLVPSTCPITTIDLIALRHAVYFSYIFKSYTGILLNNIFLPIITGYLSLFAQFRILNFPKYKIIVLLFVICFINKQKNRIISYTIIKIILVLLKIISFI